jgi:AraC-like DNA-binding protein
MAHAMPDTARSPVFGFVESVRAVAPISGRPRRVDHLPDGRTCLVFRVMERRRRGDLTVTGPRRRALLKDASGFVQAVVVQLKPGWSTPLLGVAASDLTDAYVALEDLWGRSARDLVTELLEATSVPEILDRVSRALASRSRQTFEPASAPLARRAARLLEGDDARVESVADRLGVSARHLRRAFAENIGITPKDFARSARLQRAVQMAARSSDWARIATDAGYYDQAHLITDFRELVGLTPSAFSRRVSQHDAPGPAPATAAAR